MRSLLLVLALSAALPAQQIVANRNDDGTLVTNVTMGGPNLLFGMRLVAEANYTISAVQVHTGLVGGPATMAIWSHDPINDRPLQNVSGDGSYTQSTVITWQGAALPQPVNLLQGEVFWVVWGTPNGARTPLSTNTVGDVPYRGSFDGGQTWNGANNGAQPWPARPYKIRLFADYRTNPIVPYGLAKAGTNGVPVQVVYGWPAMSNELGFVLEQAAPASPAVLALGTPTQQIQLPGLADVFVNPIVVLPFVTTGTAGRGVGTALLELPIPPVGAAGFTIALQWFVADSGAVNGIAHTDAVQTVIN